MIDKYRQTDLALFQDDFQDFPTVALKSKTPTLDSKNTYKGTTLSTLQSNENSPNKRKNNKTPDKLKKDKEPLKKLKLDDSISDILSNITEHPALKKVEKVNGILYFILNTKILVA